ncbi:MAG: iron-containing alcohol dehydrogenase [Candidatus Muiribacteriaceae bacterium]
MLNFKFHAPTEIFFGKDQIKVLANSIKRHGGSKVLLVYGKSSIKKMGLYDKVTSIFKEKEIFFKELSGVDPNPRLSSVKEGVRIIRENDIDFVLAVGAGSVLDCSKAIAAGALYAGDPWDFAIRKAAVKKALPIGTVLTLAATGSEMNGGAVITNEETAEKLPIHAEATKPAFSILDPTYTFTVPANQTAAGTADIMSHVFEQYFSKNHDAYITDRLCEGVLRTAVHYAPMALRMPDNYEARSNLMWAGTIGLNHILSCGKITDWATHLIEHEISAIYDLTHGVGLAILTPAWMRYVLDNYNHNKFCDMGRRVFDLEGEDSMQLAEETIDELERFFNKIGLPTRLSEVDIDESRFEEMAEKVISHFGSIGNFKKLNKEDVLCILNGCR